MTRTKTLEIKEKRAVLVGVDNYLDSSIGSLRFTANDVESVHDILVDTDRGKFNPDLVYLLTNKSKKETLLPFKSNVMSSITMMSKSAAPEDSILFFFSGHGIERDGRAYLLCYESRTNVLSQTALPIDWIKEVMTQSDARGKVIILDACHAGLQLGKTMPVPMTKAFEEAIFEKAEGFAILASCKMNELSHEWEEKEHGVFTYFLSEGLSGNADFDKDGIITISDASRYVSEKVKNWAFKRGYQQNPTLDYRVSGDLPFVSVPESVLEIRRIEKPEVSEKPLEKVISTIILNNTHYGLKRRSRFDFTEWANRLCGKLINFFSPDTIRKISQEDTMIYHFPLGSIKYESHVFSDDFMLTFDYDSEKGELISEIVSNLDEFVWTSLIYNFNRRFDPKKIVPWLKKEGMKFKSFEPSSDPNKRLSIEVLAIGWGRDGIPAEVSFVNEKDKSELMIVQKDPSGSLALEPNYFDKLSPQNILALLIDILMEEKSIS